MSSTFPSFQCQSAQLRHTHVPSLQNINAHFGMDISNFSFTHRSSTLDITYPAVFEDRHCLQHLYTVLLLEVPVSLEKQRYYTVNFSISISRFSITLNVAAQYVSTSGATPINVVTLTYVTAVTISQYSTSHTSPQISGERLLSHSGTLHFQITPMISSYSPLF